MTKLDRFRAELKELLGKYDASIDFSCDEWQGVSGEQMSISVDQWPKKSQIALITYNATIEAGDL